MAFGLSFGSNKQNVSQNTNFDKTENQTQSGTTSQNQTQTGTSSTTGTQTGTSNTSQESLNSGTTKQSTTGQQTQTGTTSLFSDSILSALESAGLAGLGSASGGAVDLSGLNGFDPTAYVNAAVDRATVAGRQSLDAASGQLFDSLGGTAGGNTMAALLAQQMNQANAAAVSGAQADATAQANQIIRQNLETQMAGRGQELGFVESILSQLKGGTQSTTAVGTTTEDTTGQTQSVGQNVGSESNSSTSSQQTATTQELVSIINQLLNSQSNSSGTESMTGTTKKSGGGFSLGL